MNLINQIPTTQRLFDADFPGINHEGYEEHKERILKTPDKPKEDTLFHSIQAGVDLLERGFRLMLC